MSLGRALAAEAPAAWRPRLANLLQIHAAALAAGGERWKSMRASEEAIALSRALAEGHPVHRVGLAGALRALAETQQLSLRHDEARATSREAAGIYRALRSERPGSFAPELAAALTIAAECNERAGRSAEAGSCREEIRDVLERRGPEPG